MPARLSTLLCGCLAPPAVTDGSPSRPTTGAGASKAAPLPQVSSLKPGLAKTADPQPRAETPLADGALIAAAPAAAPRRSPLPAAEPAPAHEAAPEADIGSQEAEQGAEQQAAAAAMAEPQGEQEQEQGEPPVPAPTAAAVSPRSGRATPRSGRATPRSGRVSPGSSSGKASPRTPRSYPPPPPPPPELAHALEELAAGGAAAPQLPELVPLLVRAMRSPRLDVARAAIATLRDLLGTCGAALAPHVADDSGPTTSALLCLLQKATGGDLSSRRLAPDADACLTAMVEALPPREAVSMLSSVLHSAPLRQGHGPVQAKAACVLVAAAYKLAAATPADFDEEAASTLLRFCEELLGAGAACRPAAAKLAALCRCAWGEREHAGALEGEDGWATLLRLTVEPSAAADIQGALEAHCGAGRELVEGLPAWAAGHPLGQVLARLVSGTE